MPTDLKAGQIEKNSLEPLWTCELNVIFKITKGMFLIPMTCFFFPVIKIPKVHLDKKVPYVLQIK